MATTPKSRKSDKPSIPRRGSKARAVVGDACDCCAGSTGSGQNLIICQPIGGGAFVRTTLATPVTTGRKVLCSEGGLVFWGTPPEPSGPIEAGRARKGRKR